MVFIVTNVLTVAQAHAIDFEDRFKKRVHLVDSHSGFIRNEVQRPSPMNFDHSTFTWKRAEEGEGSYRISTWWKTFDDFVAWTKSSDFALAHSQKTPEGMFSKPGRLEVHELFLSTDVTVDGNIERVKEGGSHLHLPLETNLFFNEGDSSWNKQRGGKL